MASETEMWEYLSMGELELRERHPFCLECTNGSRKEWASGWFSWLGSVLDTVCLVWPMKNKTSAKSSLLEQVGEKPWGAIWPRFVWKQLFSVELAVRTYSTVAQGWSWSLKENLSG